MSGMRFIEPCLPTISRSVPTGPQWAYEIKHDGFRFLAVRQRKQVRIYSSGRCALAVTLPASRWRTRSGRASKILRRNEIFAQHLNYRHSQGSPACQFIVGDSTFCTGLLSPASGGKGKAMITGLEVRAARAYLVWGRRDLARRAVVSLAAIKHIARDAGSRNTRVKASLYIR